jgi:RNA polymerase sigma-70 factor (ECF subfamily)
MNTSEYVWRITPTAALADAEPIEGRSQRLGSALQAFRSYLTLVARQALAPDLAAKVGASDLVQETFLADLRDITQLRDRSPANLRCWLLGILQHLLANTRRRYRATQKRQVEVEVAGCGGGDSRATFVAEVAASATSPSGRAMRHEREKALREVMTDLPEHYRQVIQWHHEERLTFEEIAGRLGVSPEAARKVWGRALVRLRETLGPGHDPR